MAEHEYRYDVTFRDFQFLQGYMTRRVMAKARGPHVRAFAGIVLCAVFLTAVIVLNVNPGRAAALMDPSVVPYPLSFYLLVIFCLLAAILTLLPAVRLRMK